MEYLSKSLRVSDECFDNAVKLLETSLKSYGEDD